jgi:hypothetical protein
MLYEKHSSSLRTIFQKGLWGGSPKAFLFLDDQRGADRVFTPRNSHCSGSASLLLGGNAFFQSSPASPVGTKSCTWPPACPIHQDRLIAIPDINHAALAIPRFLPKK